MQASRPVARFATMAAFQRCLEVWGKFKVLLIDLFMAGLANVSPDVFGCILLRRRAFLVGSPGTARLDGEQKHEREKDCRYG